MLTAHGVCSAQAFRDLQVLSQLAWFDEEFLANDPDISGARAQRPRLHLDDQQMLGRKQIEIIGKVIPVYRRVRRARTDRNLDHAVLPSDSAAAVRFQYRRGLASVRAACPRRFRYPQDAREQFERARELHATTHRHISGRALAVGRIGVGRSACILPPRRASSGRRPTTACSAGPWTGPVPAVDLPAVPVAAGRPSDYTGSSAITTSAI